MEKLTDEEFEAVIEEALDAIPDQFLEALQNIVVVWKEEPTAYHLGGEGFDEEEGWGSEPRTTLHEALEMSDDELVTDHGIVYDDEFDDEDFEEEDWGTWCNDELLGLFDGLSLEESCGGEFDDLPNVITIFKSPHERCFDTREEMVAEVGKTVIHELGHYFGLDDDKLYAMGY